jgi:DNA polymerase
VQEVIADPEQPEIVRKALEHRANVAHASFKKFPAMLAAAREDGTVGGTLNYHTAHTGRFGGRLIQPHNLTRGSIDGNEAVKRIHEGEFSVELVKSAVRPMIWHEEGMTIADYAQVEGRGVLWLCQDYDNLADYTGEEDPYILMATKIFETSYDDIDDKGRFVGKQARLGLGYQMAWKKFMSTCENYGQEVHPDICKKAVEVFRKKHPKLVQFWKDMNGAALMAMDNPGDTVRLNKHITYLFEGLWLNMILPSGRPIRYYKPNVSIDSFGRSISYMTMNDRHQYVRDTTYGGKLVENATQGMCRDLLVHGVHNLLNADIRVITHIHDEVVAGSADKERVEELITDLPDWAHDFPLAAEGVCTPRYIKA